MAENPTINLIYGPHQGEPVTRYEGPEGKVILSNQIIRAENSFNCPLSWYYMREPPADSRNIVWILEPKAVNDVDYNLDYLDKFEKVFTWCIPAFQTTKIKHKTAFVNHPSCLSPPNIKARSENEWKSWNERKNELVVIANKKDSNHISSLYWLRTRTCDWFHANSNFTVSWYGQSQPTKPYSKNKIPDKFQILNNSKFTLCSENCYHEKWSHGYFTEKLCEAWFSGTVPLYMGCYNIDEFGFDPESYIDLRKYVNPQTKKVNFNGLYDEMKSFDENKYKRMFECVLDKANILYNHISYERAYKIMLEEVSKI